MPRGDVSRAEPDDTILKSAVRLSGFLRSMTGMESGCQQIHLARDVHGAAEWLFGVESGRSSLTATNPNAAAQPFSALIPLSIDGGQRAGKPLDLNHTVAQSNPHAVCSLSGTAPLYWLPGG